MPSVLQRAHTRASKVASLSGGSLLIGLSGKDSFCTLDIASQHFSRIECFHYYFVRGMACIEGPLERLCARYKVPLHYLPHPDLARHLKWGLFRTSTYKARDLREPKREDLERHIRVKTGVEWIALGERLSDSFARRLFWRHIDGVYEKNKRCSLIVDWLDKDVHAYLQAKKIPPTCTFGIQGASTGFELRADILRWLRDHHPKDLERVFKVFPHARIQLLEQVHGLEKIRTASKQNPGIRNRKGKAIIVQATPEEPPTDHQDS